MMDEANRSIATAQVVTQTRPNSKNRPLKKLAWGNLFVHYFEEDGRTEQKPIPLVTASEAQDAERTFNLKDIFGDSPENDVEVYRRRRKSVVLDDEEEFITQDGSAFCIDEDILCSEENPFKDWKEVPDSAWKLKICDEAAKSWLRSKIVLGFLLLRRITKVVENTWNYVKSIVYSASQFILSLLKELEVDKSDSASELKSNSTASTTNVSKGCLLSACKPENTSPSSQTQPLRLVKSLSKSAKTIPGLYSPRVDHKDPQKKCNWLINQMKTQGSLCSYLLFEWSSKTPTFSSPKTHFRKLASDVIPTGVRQLTNNKVSSLELELRTKRIASNSQTMKDQLRQYSQPDIKEHNDNYPNSV